MCCLLTFQVARDLCNAVVAEQQHFQARQAWEALQPHDRIVAEVYAVKLVLHSTNNMTRQQQVTASGENSWESGRNFEQANT
jgi:hypothetical protein